MKSRKVFVVILALMMVVAFALSACGSTTPSTPPTDTGSSSSTDTTPTDNSGAASGTATADQIAQSALDYSAQVASEIQPGATSSKDTLTFASVSDPGKIAIDNLLDQTQYPFSTTCQQYFMLFDYKLGHYASPVCDSYDVDADNLGVTFHIHPGIKMNDGNTFGASDLVASIEAFRQHCGMAFQLDFVDLDNSKIIDDNTIDLRFLQPNGVWESSFEMLTLISGKAYDAVNGDESFYQAPVGPQAYDITEWVPGDHITATAFPDYFGGTPPIKTLTMKIITDRTAAFMALQNGDIDLLWNLSSDQVQSTYNSQNLKLLMTGQNMMIYMGMNAGNAALADFRVREAIFMAVNRQDIIDGAYNGLAFPATSILTREAIGYNTDYDTNSPFPAYDVDKAKQLMADAGYGNGLTLRLLAESTINFQLVAEQLSSQLAEIGITLEPTLTDYATQQSTIFSGDTSGYDMYLAVAKASGEAVSTVDNPMLFGASHPELSSDGSGTQFADLWGKVRSTADITQRAQAYKDVQAYFFEKGLYWLPLAVSQTYIGLDQNLTGVRFVGFQGFFDQAYYR